MTPAVFSNVARVLVPENKVWLEVCPWPAPAGFPSPAADYASKRIDLNEHLIRNREATFVFKVKGDSMNGVGINEGDELLVDRSIEPRHGHIVIAVLNGEFTVKRLHSRGGTVKLVAENPRDAKGSRGHARPSPRPPSRPRLKGPVPPAAPSPSEQ